MNLETKIMSELKDLEEQAAHTSSLIDMERATKRDVLAEVVEVRATTLRKEVAIGGGRWAGGGGDEGDHK